MTRELTIVVPAYNEERHIATTIEAVTRAAVRNLDRFEVIVVDDGSTDTTGQVADSVAQTDSRIRVVHQPTNRGVGAAYLIGLATAQYDAITVVPGDNAFSENTLNDVFAAVGSAPLIVSYRDNMEVRTPLRRTLSVACTWAMRLITGRHIRDAHSMFVFPVPLARQLNVQSGYGYHIESLGRLLLAAPTYREIPAILNPRPDANSGVMKASVIYLLIMTMLRLALWRLGTLLSFRSESGTIDLAALGRLALIGCAFLTLLITFQVGRNLGLHTADPSDRTRIHAIPVAISQIYHGRPHDYTADYSIAIKFQSPERIADVIADAIQAKVPPNDRTYFWAVDDRGLGDYVNMAFRLLGPRVTSLYYFWFLILGCSLTTALICFRRDPPALVAINTTMLSILGILPAYIRAPSGNATIHISESRAFEVLGAIAVIHVVLAIVRPRTVGHRQWWAFLTCQVAVLTFLMHTRSSLAWLFVALIVMAAGVAVFRRLSTDPWRTALTRSAGPAALLIGGWIAMAAYQSLMFNPAYRGEIGPRTFWHNMVMGISYNQTLGNKIDVYDGSDQAAAAAVLRYDRRPDGKPRLPLDVTVDNAMNSLGSYNSFNWRTYEGVARDLIWDLFTTNPSAALRMFVWDKPKSIIHNIACSTMLMETVCGKQNVNRPEIRVRPLSRLSIVLLLILAGSYYVAMRREQPLNAQYSSLRPILAATIWIALIGTFPSLLFYPAFTQLAGTMIFGMTSFYLAVILLLVWLAQLAMSSWPRTSAIQTTNGR